MRNQDIILSLGANLPSMAGEPRQTVLAAVEALGREVGHVKAVSSLYKSIAVTLDGQEGIPDFINACVLVETTFSPEAVLAANQELERSFGRKPAARWSARPLDIDLISYGDLVLPDRHRWQDVVESDDPAAILPEPVVPHPRAHTRGFVLAPMIDIAPDWVHPVLNKTVSVLFDELEAAGGLAGVEKISAGQ